MRLIGLNLIYAARKISPRAIRASRREAEFDRRYGTDTSGIREMSSLDVSLAVARHGVRYQAADVRLFKRALSLLTLEPSTYVFVDYGSGKGRALLLASLYPFKEVIGVEIAPELHAIAGANIRVFKDEAQRCSAIRAILQDAREFEVPPAPLVCYLHNPFDEHILKPVAANLERSFRAKPRPVWVIYHNAPHRQVFERSGRWTTVHDEPGLVVFRATKP